MKKGFTLVELIVTIGVLAILLLITAPTFENIISSSKERAYQESVKNILSAADVYVLRNHNLFPDEVGERGFVSLKTLQDAGLITNKLYDPRTDIELNGDIAVDLKSDGRYKYTYIPTNIVKTGLVLWFDGLDKGTTSGKWEDLSGNGYNGTLVNFPTSYAWQKDGLKFDGNDDYITTQLPLTNQYTMEVLYERTVEFTGGSGYRGLVGKSSYQVYGYGLRVSRTYLSGSGIGHISNRTGVENSLVQSINEAKKTTYSMAGTFDNNGNMVFYYNNVAKLNASGKTIDLGTNNYYRIGQTSQDGNFGGIIKSVRIYNRALSAEELNTNYLIDKERYNF